MKKKMKRNDVTCCDWSNPDMFGPNLLWNVVIGSVLMCLDETWCEVLWLVLSRYVWIKPDVTRCALVLS